MQAIILAGGNGTRLRPLTQELPKPMIPVLNKPLMEYTIELLKRYEIQEIGVTLKFLPQQHAQHGRLLGVLQGDGGKVHPGRVGPGGEQHAVGRLPGAEGHHQLLPVGLVDFIHPGPQEAALQFLFDMPQKRAVQCHRYGCPF